MKRFREPVPILERDEDLIPLVDRLIKRGKLDPVKPKEETPTDGDQTPRS